MVSKKLKLTAIILASTVGILIGCKKNEEYHFDGKIGDEYVKFWEEDTYDSNYLQVIRADGKKIVYRDFRYDDLRIESIIVTVNGAERKITQDKYPLAIEEAQKQFEGYLKKIAEIKGVKGEFNQEEALDLIKKDSSKDSETKEDKEYKENVYDK